MRAVYTKESDGFIVIRIQGAFTFSDLEEIQNRAKEEINRSHKVKVLVLAEQFTGWGKEGDWGDLTFMYEFDPFIEKIAIVADMKWQDQFLMFLGAGRRQATVEFFFPDKVEDARAWIKGE